MFSTCDQVYLKEEITLFYIIFQVAQQLCCDARRYVIFFYIPFYPFFFVEKVIKNKVMTLCQTDFPPFTFSSRLLFRMRPVVAAVSTHFQEKLVNFALLKSFTYFYTVVTSTRGNTQFINRNLRKINLKIKWDTHLLFQKGSWKSRCCGNAVYLFTKKKNPA